MAPPTQAVVTAALQGPWTLDGLTERLTELPRWRRPEEIGAVVAGLLQRWKRRPRASITFVLNEVEAILARPPRTRIVLDDPAPPQWRWPVEPWSDLDALSLGLDLRDGELSWFADVAGWLSHTPDGPLHHYRRRWIPSRSGVPRLIETPAPRLQELQRRIGRRVLAHIPVHDAAHGYVRGRSPVTLAAEHAGQAMVVRLDLEGFFGHVTGQRIAGLLRTAGYPPGVASALAGLLVTATPAPVLRAAPPSRTCPRARPPHPRRPTCWRTGSTSGSPGSPPPSGPATAATPTTSCSPATPGCPSTDSSRGSRRSPPRRGSGSARTRRVLPRHHRQRVTGLVLNDRPLAARAEYDALRALLHNCARTGPDAQNRSGHPAFRDHLLGRIAWVATGSPARAARLRALFAAIRW